MKASHYSIGCVAITKRKTGHGVEPQLAGGAAFRYIETSALVAAGVERDATAMHAVRGEGVRFASALTFAETRRVLAAARQRARLSPDQHQSRLSWLRRFERRCEIVEISSSVLARLGRPFAIEPVRSLDAIHLATIEALDEDPALIAVVTRDRRIAENARAMGFRVE